jgi:hypothetical protein
MTRRIIPLGPRQFNRTTSPQNAAMIGADNALCIMSENIPTSVDLITYSSKQTCVPCDDLYHFAHCPPSHEPSRQKRCARVENVEARKLKAGHNCAHRQKEEEEKTGEHAGHYREVLSTCKSLCTTTMVWYNQIRACRRGGDRMKEK